MVVLDAPASLATSRRLNLLSREYSKIFRSCLIVLLLYCMFEQKCSDFSRIVLTVNYSGALAKVVRLFPESVSALARILHSCSKNGTSKAMAPQERPNSR